jgi:hypothetical protein
MRASQFKHFRTFVLILMMISGSLSAQVTTDWKYKIAITIDSTFIDDDLVNWTLVFDQSFSPVLTQVNGPLDADGAAPSLANGADLRFSTDTAGSTELAFDIRSWTTNNDPALAECEVAVKIPFVDKDDYTVIYMWWGNASASLYAVGDPFGQYNAYDNNYRAVWTLNEDPSSAGGSEIKNRKSSSFHLTTNGGMISNQSVNAKVGKGLDFISNDFLESAENLSSNDITIETVINMTSFVGENAIIRRNNANPLQGLYIENGDYYYYNCCVGAASISTPLNTGQWYHLGYTKNGNSVTIFKDGVLTDSGNSTTHTNFDLNTFRIAGDWYGQWLEGVMDEFRISNIARSTAWLKANYHNQFNTAGFLTMTYSNDLLPLAKDISAYMNSCTPDAAYSNVGALPDGAPSNCNPTGPVANRWYKIDVPASNELLVRLRFNNATYGTLKNPVLTLWDEDGTTQLACKRYNQAGSTSLYFGNENLTSNYVYLSVDVDDIANSGSFTLCLYDNVTNDYFDGATTLTVDGPNVRHRNDNATADGPNTSCDGAPDKNRWYKFTGTSTAKISVARWCCPAIRKITITVYEENNTNQISCGLGPTNLGTWTYHNIVGLDPTKTYYFSIDTYAGGDYGYYEVDVNSSVDYDFIQGALNINGLMNSCSGDVAYSTTSATPDGPNSTCYSPIYANRWFKIQAPASGDLRIFYDASYNKNPNMTLWNADQTVQINCRNKNGYGVGGHYTMTTRGLTPGDWYYLSVDTRTNETGGFGLCIYDYVDYDYLDGAIDISYLFNGSTSNTAYTTSDATPDEASPTCFAGPKVNRWFKFTAETNTTQVKYLGQSNRDATLTVWEDDGFGGISQVTCTNGGQNSFNVNVNTVPGQLYYVSVDSRTSSTGSFGMGLNDLNPLAVCQDITLPLDASGNAAINPEDLDGGSFDNALPLAFSASQTTFTCADQGINNVILTVTDNDGYSSQCTAEVTVKANPATQAKLIYGTLNTPPSFTEQVAISTSAIEAWSVYSTDIDGDGHMDVLYASNDGKIAWYKNTDGAGTFGAEQTISTNVIVAFSVYAIDIDGDNDMDVLSASIRDNKIAWYENTDGAGTFGAQNVISTDANKATSVYSTDLDGDGDMDVLSSSFSDNKIAWYENDGTGNFGSQIVISTAASGANSVYATDMDGDGDMDVLSASWTDNKIAWYENTDGAGTFGAQNVISTVAMNASSVYATDMDGDGDMDVLSASNDDHKIAWYENTDGDGTFGAQQVISTAALRTRSVYATDLDGDGDMDVLSASYADNKIAWYKNTDGDGTFGAQQVISTAALGAISVYATDIDGDGDMDVLSASSTDDKIAWYKNDLLQPQCDGDIQFNEEGGDATAWTWTSTNGAVSFDPNNTDQNPLVSNIADGDTVRVVITDGNGCTSRASVHMYINPLPDSSLDVSDPAVCLGQDATITVSASVVGVTYQLQLDSDDSPVGAPKAGTGGAIDFVLLAPTTTGDYNVLSYFDATGCEVELVEKSTVFVNDLPGCPILWTGSKYAFGSGIDDAPGIADGNKGFVVQGPGAILPGDARVDYMTVEAGQDITVPSGISISVVDAINNEGTVTVKSSGSIVQESVADNNTGAGIYHIERDDIRDNTQFQIWSSPLQAAPLMGPGGVFDGSNPCRTMVWNASSQRWKYDYVPNTVFDCGGGNITFSNRFLMFDDPADNLMDPARGYFIPGQVGTPLIVFSGKINNGPIVKPVFETVSTSPYTGDDWNLLGNPYPSALGITEWLDANAAILKTNAIYLWDDDGSGGSDYDEYDDYATVNQFGFVGGENGNGKYPTAPVGIATAQGFFIEASASGNVTFSNDMRITGENDKFYKTQPDDNPRLWINLNNQEGLQRQTLIGFASDATFQKDEKYDAPVLNANGILSIGSMLESTPMAIQAQPLLEEGDERMIPLHMFSKNGGKATLSFTQNETMNEVEVYLKMPQQIAEYPAGSVPFDVHLNKGENPGYALVFRKGSVLANGSINKVFGWELINSNDELIIEITGNLDTDTRVEVLDIKGIVHETVILSDRITRINTQNWAAGMYLVHLTSGTVDEVKRVVIR